MQRLTLREVTMVDMYVKGAPHHKIARRYGLSRNRVTQILNGVSEKLEIKNTLLLGIYWCCPLFRSGLKALDILPK